MPASAELVRMLEWAQDNLAALLLGLVALVLTARWSLRGLGVGSGAQQPQGGRGQARAHSSRAVQPLDGSDADLVRSLRRTIEDLKSESSSLFSYFMLLPDLTKRINSIKEKRRVAPLMVEMLDQIFEPRKILIFFANDRNKVLYLGGEKGFDKSGNVKLGHIVQYGEGRIGWMAQSGAQDAMDRQNFELEERSAGMSFELAAHASFETELCAPMRHNNELLGVISVGGIHRRPRAEKRMLEMVADLGAMALNNIYQFNKIQVAANTDGLTQLCNKGYFQKRLGEELAKAQHGRYPLSLFIFDIDHFKKYNDAHGHLAGDECLKLTANVVKESVREDDVAARYGGEEFIVILPNTHRDGALRAGEKIRLAIESQSFTPPHPVNPGGKVTISGGVATYPDDGLDATSLISKADAGLYEAKRQGRNRVLVTAAQPQQSAVETHSL